METLKRMWRRWGRSRLLVIVAGGLALCCLCAALGAVLPPGETPAPTAQVVVRLLATATAPATLTTTPVATPAAPSEPTAEPSPTATPETPPATAPAGDPAGYPCLTGLSWQDARPVRVVDGDTLDVVMPDGRAERVRLIGIDTPERGEPGYTEATQAHAALLAAPLRLARDVNDRDRYGRLLRYVVAADGRSVNHELVRAGWARTLTIPPDVRCADELVTLQREAQAQARGLWAQAAAAPPPATDAPAQSGTITNNEVDPPWWPCQQGQLKGNRNSGIYHAPGQRDYARTYANVQCFNTDDEAVAAGYRKARR